MDADVSLPMLQQVVFKLSYRLVLMRLISLAVAALRWYWGRFIDRLRGQDTIGRQALRLRLIIEGLGGTAVKVGQQMALRVDLLPFEFGQELSKMLDKVPPFPTAYAVHRIELQTGKPLAEVFPQFDPEPIGSGSVACVYQGITREGEKVAIKVRRPGVGEIFVADCAALEVGLKTLEALTLLHEGFSTNFLVEFQTMLLEELDFVREARNTELFRRSVRKKLRHVTAPRVYFEYSGRDVLVTEFVTGVWVGELIAALEHQDEKALAYLREQNIDAKTVAKRLIGTNQFGAFENLLFHADPHPSNVLIWPNNELVFIDFGSCGAYTERERVNWRQLTYYHSKCDIGHMVQSALAILEPLPPIDVDEFSKRLEAVFWRDLYAFESKHSQWWERTSARIWMSFLNLSREFNVPMNLNTLRMIRSTLLYEVVAARLHPGIDSYKENERYSKEAGKRARKRVRRAIHKRMFEGLTKLDYLRVEQLFDMGKRAMYLAQRFLDASPYRFSMLISKVVYAVTTAIQTFVLAALTAFAIAAIVIVRDLIGRPAYHWRDVDLWTKMRFVAVDFRPFQFLIVVILLLRVRKVYLRLNCKDVNGECHSGLS